MATMEDNILLDQLEYDVIILGTSLTETILSAALAKVGKKIAHFDKNEWYGGAITSQTLLNFKENLESTNNLALGEIPENSFPIINNNLKIPIINFSSSLYQYKPSAKEEKSDNAEKKEDNELQVQMEEMKKEIQTMQLENVNNENNENKESEESNSIEEDNGERKLRAIEDSQWKLLTKDDRRYCLDLLCNTVWSVGDDVSYLVDSGVHRYLEFKTFQNSYIYSSSSQSLELVPASKGEIFKTKYLSLMEKRSLTRFMNYCLAEEIPEDVLQKNFRDFLNDQRLPYKLQEFLLYAVIFQTSATTQITTKEGIEKMKQFSKSTGRFGSTPFIFPLYGNSELPQAFSRLSAVYGTDFVLKKTVNYLTLEEQKDGEEGVKYKNICCSANQPLSAPYFVCSESYLSSKYQKVLSRAICITTKAIKDEGYLSYFVFPPSDSNPNTIFVHQFDSSMYLSPPGKYVIHFSCVSHGNTARDDLQHAVDTLLSSSSEDDSDKPKVDYQMYFNTIAYDVDEEKLPKNVIVTHEARDMLVGFSYYFDQAKKIFYQICSPDEEFLPSSNQINLDEELSEIMSIENNMLSTPTGSNTTVSDSNNNVNNCQVQNDQSEKEREKEKEKEQEVSNNSENNEKESDPVVISSSPSSEESNNQ